MADMTVARRRCDDEIGTWSALSSTFVAPALLSAEQSLLITIGWPVEVLALRS